MESCFYNTKNCHSKITREHVISKTVLQECFGEENSNFVTADIFGDKVLFNHEQTVKDVCKTCNETLSPYDIAGQKLLKHIIAWSAGPLDLPINNESLNWLIKTHLNFFRVIRDSESNSAYPIKQKIKNALINGRRVPSELYELLVEEWENSGGFWDVNSPDKISFFQYRSIRFRGQHIVLSNLRLRNLNTLLMLPSNKEYKNFPSRVRSCLDEIKNDYVILFNL